MHLLKRADSAKDRCWSANSSGMHTVGSMDSSFASLASTSGASRSHTASAVADAATRPTGISADMMDSLIALADQTSKKLVQEAQACLETPMKRKNVQLLARTNGIDLYESLPPPPPSTLSPTRRAQSEPKESLSRSLWNRLTHRRKRAKPTTLDPAMDSTAKPLPPLPHVPRVFGVAQVHVPLDELLDVVGHRSPHSSSLLHPGMTQSTLRHALIDLVDEHASLRTMVAPSSGDAEARDFLMVEYHRKFTTASGRRGVVIACHSVNWTRCPSPREDAVRASMYRSGLVALECEHDADRVELFCAAELNLKGDASEQLNFEASRRRVQGTLSRITVTIEERAKMLLSLDHTRVFHKARRAAAHEEVCSSCKDRIGKLPPATEPYVCRKCYAKVCGDCSSIWQRGRKDMRLCMECWADATLNRT